MIWRTRVHVETYGRNCFPACSHVSTYTRILAERPKSWPGYVRNDSLPVTASMLWIFRFYYSELRAFSPAFAGMEWRWRHLIRFGCCIALPLNHCSSNNSFVKLGVNDMCNFLVTRSPGGWNQCGAQNIVWYCHKWSKARGKISPTHVR